MRVGILVVAAVVLAVCTAGCRVESNKHGDGDDVKIATPFGGMSVKTDNSQIAQNIGLPIYPGAVPVVKKDNDGHDNGSADVDMSFGNFQLRVKAVSYTSADSTAQVLAFYQKGMSRFGTVIQCSGHQPVGTPTQTAEGLNCSDDGEHSKNVHVADDMSGKMELKAGSTQHQHIVSIDPQGAGTKFGLVALDLPGKFPFGAKDKESKDSDDKDDGQQ